MTPEEREFVRLRHGEWTAAKSAADAVRDRLRAAMDVAAAVDAAAAIILNAAEEIHTRLQQQIAEVVSACLQSVFGTGHVARLHVVSMENRQELRLELTKGGESVDIMDGSGGAVVDVAAWAIRLACFHLHRPHLRRTLVLDEPFRCVSIPQSREVAAMLQSMVQRYAVQVVIVTHNAELLPPGAAMTVLT